MRESRALAVTATMIGTVLSMLDQTIANTALPTIARDVHASPAASIWVINAYQLALTVTVIPISSLSDIVGYRRMYQIGLTFFVLASLGCVLSHSLWALVAARFVQGISGAAMTSSTGPLLRSVYPPERLGSATGFTAMAVALGSAAGPVVSGGILSIASWQWLFALNIPFGLLAMVLSAFFIVPKPGTGARFDATSAVLSMVFFGLAVFGFDGFSHAAPLWSVALELAAAVALGFVFIRRQLALPSPMFAVDLFARRPFTLALASCYLSFVAQTIAYVALPFAFQVVMGRSPLEVGILLLPWLLAAAVFAPVAGRLADRFNSSRLAALGLAVFGAGLVLTLLLPPHASSLDIAWRMLLAGIGWGLFQSPNNRSIQGSVTRERSGAAQGMQSVARLTGQTTGAVAVAVVFGASERGAHAAQHLSGGSIAIAMAIAAAAAFLGVAASVWRGTITGAIRFARAS